MAKKTTLPLKINWIDRAIGFISPRAYNERIRERMVSGYLERKHEAAGRGRRHAIENDMSSTANQAIGAELSLLRVRSQNQIQNNGYASQGQTVLANGIVGTGITPSVRNVSKELERVLLSAWREWSADHYCDHYQRESFAGIQQAVIRSVISCGEAVIRRRRTSKGFTLQVQEGDYIDTSQDGYQHEGGGFTMHGIVYNEDGQVTGYWLFDNLEQNSPWRAQTQSRMIPASEIIHVFYADRAGQRRGLPWLRKSYVRLEDINRYEDAEMQAKLVAACHAAFISGGDNGLGIEIASDEDRIARLEPGMINYLRPGESVNFNTPGHAANYGEYMNSQLRGAAAGIGTSYEALTGDYSQVNFSSGRMGWIEAGRNYAEKRERVMTYFLNRVWEWFMESMYLAGVYGETLAAALAIKADWTAPRREMLDPVKESEGLRLQIACGLISWQEAVRSMGGDPDDVSTEIMASLELFDVPSFTPSWAVDSKELHELAKENEAKQTTADAAKTSAESKSKA